MTVTAAGAVFLIAMSAQAPPPAPSDVDSGRVLFEGTGQCLSCHRVADNGARVARDLSWIGLLRTPETLRAALTDPLRHPSAASLTPAEVDRLVAYLRTRRTLWALSTDAAEREIAPATENAPFFNRPQRDEEERPALLMSALQIRRGATVADTVIFAPAEAAREPAGSRSPAPATPAIDKTATSAAVTSFSWSLKPRVTC